LIEDDTTATKNKRCYYIQQSNAITLYEVDSEGNETVRNLIISTTGKDDNATYRDLNDTVSMEIKQGFIELETITFTDFSVNHVFKGKYADGVELTGTKKLTYRTCKEALSSN